MENSDSLKKKWIKIYPSYLDKALKHSEGRKVSNTYAVENPSVKEIFGVCAEILNLNSKLENHHHPQDYMKRGRVIVELKKDNTVLSSEAKNKNQLLKLIGDTINKYREKYANKSVIEEDTKKRRKKK